MDNIKYSTIQMNDAENLVDALISAPKNKLTIMTVMVETFISGMRAQEYLARTQKTKGEPDETERHFEN